MLRIPQKHQLILDRNTSILYQKQITKGDHHSRRIHVTTRLIKQWRNPSQNRNLIKQHNRDGGEGGG